MKISGETILRAGLVAAGVLLGTGGTLGTQQITSTPAAVPPIPASPPSKPAASPIIYVTPKCPDIYLDNVKVKKHGE